MENNPLHNQQRHSNFQQRPDSHEIIVSLTAAEAAHRSSSNAASPAALEAISSRFSNQSLNGKQGSVLANQEDDDEDEEEEDEKEGQNQAEDDINKFYTAFSEGHMIKGILCPSLTNSFHSPSLERSYLTYSHRQRQKSLIIVNVVDMLVKIILAVVYVWRQNPQRVSRKYLYLWIIVSMRLYYLLATDCYRN